MKSLVLVHGAGSGPWVFDGWPEAFPGSRVVAVDLQEGLDVARASLGQYAEAVVRGAAGLPRPLAVVGWSLGGLVALIAAPRVRPDALVLLEASPPREVQGERAGGPREGTFVPEPSPSGLARRPESLWAMGERDRGAPAQPPPPETRTLVVCGDALLHDRGPALAAYLGAEFLAAGPASHEDMVRSPQLRALVADWLERATLSADPGG